MGKDRHTIWVDPEFKNVRDKLSADLDIRKEDVTRELARMAKEDYDGIVKKLLRQTREKNKSDSDKKVEKGGFDPIF